MAAATPRAAIRLVLGARRSGCARVNGASDRGRPCRLRAAAATIAVATDWQRVIESPALGRAWSCSPVSSIRDDRGQNARWGGANSMEIVVNRRGEMSLREQLIIQIKLKILNGEFA